MKIVQIDIDMPKNCFDCGLKFRGTCPRLIKSVQGLRKERLEECPLKEVEAIPKDQYETRLKADMVAMLTELQLEIDEIVKEEEPIDKTWAIGLRYSKKIIQQKINALGGGENEHI